jgi:hypothetical protein
VLNVLNERKVFGGFFASHRKIHQDVFGNRVVQERFEFLDIDLKALRSALAAVNDSGNASRIPELLGSTATIQDSRICG